MLFAVKLTFLGNTVQRSKKSDKEYMLPKFIDMASQQVYEFYLPADKIALVTKVAKLQPLEETNVVLKLSSFNSKPQVDLENIKEKA